MATKNPFCKIEIYSEDVAEIRSAIYMAFNHINPERANELKEIMDKIYNSLFTLNVKPVLLLDRDGRQMEEWKS